jgi:hypothetical protein
MDADTSKLIDLAANITASGRWEAVNKRIGHLAADPGDEWWVRVFVCLYQQVSSEYSLLKFAHQEEQSAALIAWRARNLLELAVWCFYCEKNRENAHRLYEDAGRDVRGLIDVFAEWAGAIGQDPQFRGAKQDLLQRAADHGVDSIDGPYKKVGDAAEECGLRDVYRAAYRMLSKFAHPTAMQIIALPNEAQTTLQRDVFFGQGCMFFAGAFGAIERATDMRAVVPAAV